MKVLFDGDDFIGELDDIEGRLRNMRPAFDRIVEDFHQLMGDVFTSRGAAIRRRWRPNSPAYAALPGKRGKPIGIFTGLLHRSLTSTGTRYSRVEVRDDTVKLGTKAPHFHLFSDGRGGQPARNLEPQQRVLSERWVPIVEQHLFPDREFDGTV